MIRNTKQLYGVAGLGLLALTLMLFAIIWPLNAAPFDDWFYLYESREGVWHVPYANREFVFGGTSISQWLMGDRAERVQVVHVACTFGVALGLFHLFYRLSGARRLAFMYAALYLAYIPSNYAVSRALFVQPYTWVLLLGVIALILLLAALETRSTWRYGFWVGSAALSYVVLRAYEGFIPLLPLMPIIFWFLLRWRDKADGINTDMIFNPTPNPSPYHREGLSTFGMLPSLPRSVSKRSAGLVLWYGVVLIGVLAFAIPFINESGSVGYQTGISAEGGGLGRLIANSREYYALSFPLDALTRFDLRYALPALLMVGLFLMTWRMIGGDAFQDGRAYALMFGLGLLLTGLGGAAFIYADLQAVPRAHYFAAAGQVLAVMGVLGGLSLILRRLKIGSSGAIMAALVGLLLFQGAGWYAAAQRWAIAEHGAPLDVRNRLFADMLALMPNIAPETALLYRCSAPNHFYQDVRHADPYAIRYLYPQNGVELVMLRYRGDQDYAALNFDATGLDYQLRYPYGREARRYGYDAMIVLECAGDTLHILDVFPSEIAPEGAQIGHYNPYARLGDGFIRAESARILAR